MSFVKEWEARQGASITRAFVLAGERRKSASMIFGRLNPQLRRRQVGVHKGTHEDLGKHLKVE